MLISMKRTNVVTEVNVDLKRRSVAPKSKMMRRIEARVLDKKY